MSPTVRLNTWQRPQYTLTSLYTSHNANAPISAFISFTVHQPFVYYSQLHYNLSIHRRLCVRQPVFSGLTSVFLTSASVYTPASMYSTHQRQCSPASVYSSLRAHIILSTPASVFISLSVHTNPVYSSLNIHNSLSVFQSQCTPTSCIPILVASQDTCLSVHYPQWPQYLSISAHHPSEHHPQWPQFLSIIAHDPSEHHPQSTHTNPTVVP